MRYLRRGEAKAGMRVYAEVAGQAAPVVGVIAYVSRDRWKPTEPTVCGVDLDTGARSVMRLEGNLLVEEAGNTLPALGTGLADKPCEEENRG